MGENIQQEFETERYLVSIEDFNNSELEIINTEKNVQHSHTSKISKRKPFFIPKSLVSTNYSYNTVMPSEESQLSKRHHLEDPTRKTSNQKLQTPRSDAEVLSLFGYSKEKSTITCSLDNSEVIHNNNLVGFSPHDLALCFPDKNLIARGPPLPSPLALHFESFFQYQQTYCNILRDYLNFVTYKTARIYHEILSSVDFSPSLGVDLINSAIKSEKIPFCEHGKTKLFFVKKEGPNKGKGFFACSSSRSNCNFFQWEDDSTYDLSKKVNYNLKEIHKLSEFEQFCMNKKVEFYGNSEVQISKHGFSSNLIKLRLSRKLSSKTYSKQDLWALSKDLRFSSCCFGLSTFFGPTLEGEVELALLGNSPFSNGEPVHAIRVCHASTEVQCYENLSRHMGDSTTCPIYDFLLGRQTQSGTPTRTLHISVSQKFELVESFITKYALNNDQSLALKRLADMMDNPVSVPILLIHGVFGAEHRPKLLGPPWKIMLCSANNVAVDRILLSLLALDFDGFVRVGSMRKIAKRILPLSLHTSSQDIADLKAMLKDDSLSREDREYVRQTLQKVQKKENEQKVLKVRVVGVTCLASCFPCLNGFSFPIIILDECSQITEPLSCLSIARFHCNKLILVGDPKQLPPTITAVDHASSFKNLEFTLFERLLACGYEKIFLKTQYRCHPEISRLASDLFYDSQVVSGISSAERVPLLEELPCLLFVDVEANQEIRDPTGSYKNLKEAHVISEALKRLVVFGLSTAEIGVISLYKSQSRCIQEIYGESCQQPVMISTVDAFQGGEREVILLSTVRISSDYTFLENERRVNVALTRAKRHLLIFGSLKHLQKNKLWAKIINYCEKKKFVRKSDFLFKTAEAESSADL